MFRNVFIDWRTKHYDPPIAQVTECRLIRAQARAVVAELKKTASEWLDSAPMAIGISTWDFVHSVE